MKKVYVETLGCQMNKSDSERVLGMLSHFDYMECEEPKEADLLILNTCSIRKLSECKAYSRIGVWNTWKKSHPQLKIALCGCVVQQHGAKLLSKFPYLDLIFGTHNIYQLPELIKRVENDERVCAVDEIPYKTDETKFKINRADKLKLNAWVPIIEGCNNFCTYCIVPYARGRERSRNMDKIIKETKIAVAEGFREITLLGQNVDSYGKDFKDGKTTLANLLRELNKIEGNFRIRFVTSYPTDITDDLIDAVDECDKVCKYFHIPMQSGNSEILKLMNRRYNREEYTAIVKKIRDRFKQVTITSDFIAGFPGETEEQFQDTLSAIEELGLDYSNTAAYSPRERTVAAKWIDKFLSEEVKKERLNRLNNTNKKACIASNKRFIGEVLNVLVEEEKMEDNKRILTARAENNKIVHFESKSVQIGDFCNVKIKQASTWCVKGELVKIPDNIGDFYLPEGVRNV